MGLLQKTGSVNAKTSLSGKPLNDFEEFPVPGQQFSIFMDKLTDPVAIFQSLSGLSVKRKVETFDVGGMNDHGLELPGPLSYGHVTFNIGWTSSTYFWDWMLAGRIDGYAVVKEFTLEQRRPNPASDSPIFKTIKTWNFHNAFPVNWSLSALAVDDPGKIAIETIEIAFSNFEIVTTP